MFVRTRKLKEAHKVIEYLQEERKTLQKRVTVNAEGWDRANKGWQTSYDLLCEAKVQLEAMQRKAEQLTIQLAHAISASRENRKGSEFSQDEISTLISLCHPDKHNNSDRATVMTQRLLELRK